MFQEKQYQKVSTMKIKTEIIERINGRADIKRALIGAFNVSRASVWRFLKENETNGPLTTAAALKIISDGLNVSTDDILVAELVTK